MTVIFISHRLEEVMDVSDTVTVLRHGKEVATRPTAGLKKSELVQMMVGRPVSFDRRPRPPTDGEPVLQVRDLWARDDRRLPALAGVSFDVRAGEIVGIAGVAGNGQTELAEVIAGLRPASHGSITLDGRPIVGRSAREIRLVRSCPCARRPFGARRRPARIDCVQHPDGTAGPGALVASRHHFPDLSAAADGGADQALRHSRARDRTRP